MSASTKKSSLYDTINKTKFKTFPSIYKLPVTNEKQKTVIKADHELFLHIIIASEAGCDINIDDILKHELSRIPLFLATTA